MTKATKKDAVKKATPKVEMLTTYIGFNFDTEYGGIYSGECCSDGDGEYKYVVQVKYPKDFATAKAKLLGTITVA